MPQNHPRHVYDYDYGHTLSIWLHLIQTGSGANSMHAQQPPANENDFPAGCQVTPLSRLASRSCHGISFSCVL